MDCNCDQYSNCPRQGWVCLTLSAASSERRADEKNDYQGKNKVFEKEEDEISIIDCRRRWNYLVNHVGQPVKEYGKQCSLKHVDSEREHSHQRHAGMPLPSDDREDNAAQRKQQHWRTAREKE